MNFTTANRTGSAGVDGYDTRLPSTSRPIHKSHISCLVAELNWTAPRRSRLARAATRLDFDRLVFI